jgi:amino acid transporter
MQLRQGSVTAYHENFFTAFKPASFKRNPNACMLSEATDDEGGALKDQSPDERALTVNLVHQHQ